MCSGRDNVQRDRPSMSRTIGYTLEAKGDLEYATDDLLKKEIERKGTPITQYGCKGNSDDTSFLWINGAPGAEFRRVLTELENMGWRRTKS